jgi:hypothetical protein
MDIEPACTEREELNAESEASHCDPRRSGRQGSGI